MKLICILGIVGILVIFYPIVLFLELPLLRANLPQLPDDVKIEQWETRFTSCALAGVVFAGVMSFLWYVLAQWKYKINDPQATKGKRASWVRFLVLSVGSVIAISVIFTLIVKRGTILAYLFFFLNGSLCYYLSTLLFSPSSFKYIPWGAAQIRYW